MQLEITKEAEDLAMAQLAVNDARERLERAEAAFVAKYAKHGRSSKVSMMKGGKVVHALVVNHGVTIHNLDGILAGERPEITLTTEGMHGRSTYYLHDVIDCVVPPQAPQVVVWNTGRLYTQHTERCAGQVIAAKRVEGGAVFFDVSRGIDGFVKGEIAKDASLPQFVMAGYDTYNEATHSYNYDNFPYGPDSLELKRELSQAASAFINAPAKSQNIPMGEKDVRLEGTSRKRVS